MSKMKELSMVLDELVTCGEALISAANTLKEIFSEPAANTGPAAKTTKSPKGKAAQNQAETCHAAASEKPDPKPAKSQPAPKSYTKEEVRGILAGISSAGHSDEVRALLLMFGAKQLKQVDPKDYPALVKEAAAIEKIKTDEDEVNADE